MATFLFPGQSSRAEGMLAPLRARAPELVRRTLARASDVLGRDLTALDAGYESNREVQVAVFVTNHLHRLALERVGVHAVASAGLSLGEYNHLVEIGALEFEDALRLVDERGRLYDEGPSGAMAAVFPVAKAELEALIAEADGDVWISNENSLSQFVIAGERGAVERTCALVEDELYAHTKIIERRIPMHTPRFAEVAERFVEALEAAPWRTPRATYWSNVTAAPIVGPSRARLIESMRRHVCERVRWQALLEALAQAHPGVPLLEVGPGTVLHDLFRRSRIERTCHHTATEEAWAAAAALGPGKEPADARVR